MSGCNCKTGGNKDALTNNASQSNENLGQKIVTYALKSFAFILLLVALPIINLFIIWFMFKTLVLNKDINMKPLLLAIGQKFKEKEEDDEDIDYDNLTEDDVVMVDVEEITSTSK
jgi:hypothetical protein